MKRMDGAKIAYVVNYYSGTVAPIRTATHPPERPIRVGLAPDAIAITANDRRSPAFAAATRTRRASSPSSRSAGWK
jgi:hypothetical protein